MTQTQRPSGARRLTRPPVGPPLPDAPVVEPVGTAATFFPAWLFTALYAVLLLCIPSRLIVGPIGAPGTPANLLAIAGLLWWCCAVTGGLNPRRGLSPVRTALALLVACLLASYVAGHLAGWYQPADIHQRSDRLWQAASASEVTATVGSAADRGLLALAGFAGIVLITSEGIRSWRELERVNTWIVGAASFVASLGILQYFTRINLAAYMQVPGLTPLSEFGAALSRSMLNRVVSTSAHPIELGVIMAAILPLALHRSLHSGKWTAWIPTGLIGLTALMSVSRSAIVVGGIALLVMFLGWPNRWRLIALLAAPVAAVIGPIALPGLLGTIRSLFTNLEDDPSVAGRTDDYELVFRLVSERPIFGQGFFSFVPMVYRTIDNQALVLLLEIGIVGTLAFAALIVVGLRSAWAPRRLGGDERQRHLGLAVAASLTGIVTSYFTFDALGFRQVAGMTFLLIGLAGAVWQLTRDGPAAGAVTELSSPSQTSMPTPTSTAPVGPPEQRPLPPRKHRRPPTAPEPDAAWAAWHDQHRQQDLAEKQRREEAVHAAEAAWTSWHAEQQRLAEDAGPNWSAATPETAPGATKPSWGDRIRRWFGRSSPGSSPTSPTAPKDPGTDG